MYAVECVIECQSSDGSPILPGKIIIDPLAWGLCMPGVRNAEPRFKPADAVTAAKVNEELARNQPQVDATLRDLQERIDAMAEEGKFKIDPATGFFARLPNGDLAGSPSNLDAHVMETADAYHLKPAVPTRSL